jgi:hypothetical protein
MNTGSKGNIINHYFAATGNEIETENNGLDINFLYSGSLRLDFSELE